MYFPLELLGNGMVCQIDRLVHHSQFSMPNVLTKSMVLVIQRKDSVL